MLFYEIFSNNKLKSSQVALVQLFENDTLVTGIITDKSKSGMTTIFMPTGPSPNSGNMYHVKNKYVHPIDAKVADVIRTTISLGRGSAEFIDKLKKLKDSKD